MPPSTLEDLARTKDKAELIGGLIVLLPLAGLGPARSAGRILRNLHGHAEGTGQGEVFTGSVAYTVAPLRSGRESFSPDASYFRGPFPDDEMKFLEGAPTFAVEIRNIEDLGPAAEAAMAAKRVDYFEAGTLVVWDVDLEAKVVRKYRPEAPDLPIVFRPGEQADAEPAVPGWRMDVDRIFA